MENCDHIVVLGSTLTALAIIRAAKTLRLDSLLLTREGESRSTRATRRRSIARVELKSFCCNNSRMLRAKQVLR